MTDGSPKASSPEPFGFSFGPLLPVVVYFQYERIKPPVVHYIEFRENRRGKQRQT